MTSCWLYEVLVPGKEIVAKVQERQKAEQMYEKAKLERKTAVLLSEIRPDIFELKLGSLSARSECLVTVRYVMELPVEDTKTRLTIPTTIAPKYVPGRGQESSVVPRALKNILYKKETPAPLSLTVRILMRTVISSVESPSHTIQYELQEGRGKCEGRAKFAGDTAALDRDIVILIGCQEPHQPKVLLEKGRDGTVAAMMTLVPSFQIKKQQSECVFLIDCSGSMGGQSMKLAREALSVFINSLPVDCHFNVYCFGSRYNKLFPTSRPLTDQTLEAAKSLVAKVDSNLGGTELLSPLQDILQQPLAVGKPRQVFVITDGQVSNTREIISLVNSEVRSSRLFSLGIGASADRHLVKGISRVGAGTAEFVSLGEKISGVVVRQLKRGLQPCLQDVNIDWGDSCTDSQQGPEHCQAPALTPPLYDGSRMILYKLWESEARLAGRVTITAKTPEGDLQVELEISEDSYTEGDLVHKMFARKMIQDLEERHDGEDKEEVKAVITDLALRYNLSSRFTSFIGVNEKANETEDGYLVTRQVHNMVPLGMSVTRSSKSFLSANKMISGRRAVCSDGIDSPPGAVAPVSLASNDLSYEEKDGVPRSRAMRVNMSMSIKGGSTSSSSDGESATDRKQLRLTTDMERLLALISLQTAAGAFRYDKSLLDEVIGAQGEKFRLECEERNVSQDNWLTALIVAFIEVNFAAERDTWELVIEKSRDWLGQDSLIQEAKMIID